MFDDFNHVLLQIIHTYFPFQPVIHGNFTRWGASKSIRLTDNASYTDISLFAKHQNFNGFPLEISYFWRYPTSMNLNELSTASQHSYIMKDSWRSENSIGMDGFMLSSLAKTFNFTPILVRPRGAEFGYKSTNGKFLGNFICRYSLLQYLF